MKTTSTIPGGIAVAFQTRRKELLVLELSRLRHDAVAGELGGERLEHVLNALEMLAYEMWEMQDALATILQVEKDIDAQVTGMRKLSNVLFEIARAAKTGEDIPEGGPRAVYEHFKQKVAGEGG